MKATIDHPNDALINLSSSRSDAQNAEAKTIARQQGFAGSTGRWLTLFVCACGWLMSLSEASAQASTIEEVTTFRKFYSLSSEQALRGRAVRFKGVVLCYDSEWNQLYFYDGIETIYFNPRDFRTQPEHGQSVEITGTTTLLQGNYALTNLNLAILGRGTLPPAKRLELPQLASDSGQWVETSGRVRVAEGSRGRLALLIHKQGQSCLVYVMGSPGTNDFKLLVGCDVRIRGINASKAVGGRLDSAVIFAPGFDEVSILERSGTNALQIPVSSIGGLLNRELGSWTNNLVHVSGLVSAHQPGQSLLVKDPTGVVRAQVMQVTQTQPDQRVDLWGFLKVSLDETFLNDAYFEVVQPPPRLVASPTARGLVPSARNQPELLTLVSEIVKLRSEEAAQHIPVRLRGVMTYADPEWHTGFFQDQSGAVFVQLNQKEVQPRQWVELMGQTGPGGFAPEVLNSSLQVLGMTNLPTAIKVDLQDLANGQLDAHWVEMEGVVRRLNEQWGHLQLSLRTRKGRFNVIIPDFDGKSLPTHLIDALVSVRGACSSELNVRRQLTGITLQVPSLDEIRILEPAPTDPFAGETTRIEVVATFDPDRLAGRRVKISGLITLRIPGNGFFLQDASGGIRVQTQQTNDVQTGDMVEVLGFPALGDFSPTLDEAIFRTTGPGSPPVPTKTTAEQILMHGTNDALLVLVEARLLQDVARSAKPRLVLQDGPIIFTAQIETPIQTGKIPVLKSGSLVRLTGVCSIEGSERHEPKAFRLLLRQPGDIELLETPPWWNSRHAFLLAGGMAFLIAAALAWAWLLRRQVRAQTEVIQRKLEEGKKFAESLAREKNLLATLIDHLPDNVFVKDREGHYLLTNRAHARFHGAPSTEHFSGKSASELFPPEVARSYSESDQRVFDESLRVFEEEERSSDVKGNPRWVSTTKVPLKDGSGNVIGLVGISRDVTEWKKTENQLRQLSGAVEQSAASIVITDTKGCIEYVNPAFTSVTGYALAEIAGKDLRGFKSVIEQPVREHDLWKTVSEGGEWKGEVRSRRRNGEMSWESAHFSAIKSPAGIITHFLAIYEDITERKRAEAELETVHRELLEVSRQAGMAEVATGVLHNVGNVLNSVNVSSTLAAENLKNSGLANLSKAVALLREHEADLAAFLTSDPRGKQLPEYLEHLSDHLAKEQAIVLQELAHLQKNIEHIKDVVAMQQSYAKVSGVTETVQISDLVEDALRMNASALVRHEVQTIREFAEVRPITVEKHKVLQILVNLIRNAKYACDEVGCSDKRLTVRVVNGDGRVKISVIDTGVGIPAENLTRIFNHGFTTREEGHGFGLHSGALAAKEMGGSLSVHSDGVGRGATFTLELPLQLSKEAHG